MHRFKFVRSFFVLASVCAVVALTAMPALATFPGKNGKIVFVANPGGSWQLYTINPDGSDMTQITNLTRTASEFWTPNYSPDGTKILFSYGQINANAACQCDLYVMNADRTGSPKNLTNDGLSQFGHWSPDGSRIVFAWTIPQTGQWVITTMESDGTGKRTKLTSPFWLDAGNAYTPDGTQIAFDGQQGGFVSAVWTMTTEGHDEKRITPAPLEGCMADISPDGQHVLMLNHCNTALTVAIFAANLNGTDRQQLTHPPKGKTDIPWGYSPDGTKIVFVSNRMSSNQSLDLYKANSDGTHIQRIASGLTVGGCPDGNCVTPSWGPKAK
jgi:Tol biopolymer transport system component